MTLSEDQIQRYARHIILREVGGRGQQRLLEARVRVPGGHRATEEAARYLTAAGVGTLVLDPEIAARLGSGLKAMNPDVTVTADGPWDGTVTLTGREDRLAGAMAALATLVNLTEAAEGGAFTYDGREARWATP